MDVPPVEIEHVCDYSEGFHSGVFYEALIFSFMDYLSVLSEKEFSNFCSNPDDLYCRILSDLSDRFFINLKEDK